MGRWWCRRQNKEPLGTCRVVANWKVLSQVCFEGNPSGLKGSPQAPLRFPFPRLEPKELFMR
jgi:hypothetical protein